MGARTLKATAIGQWNAALDSSGDERAREAEETISRESDRIESLREEIANANKELDSLNIKKEK